MTSKCKVFLVDYKMQNVLFLGAKAMSAQFIKIFPRPG